MTGWIISSSALLLLLLMLRRISRGRISSRLGYALWALALLRLLVPVSFGGTALSIMNTAGRIPVIQDAEIISGYDNIEYRNGNVTGYNGDGRGLRNTDIVARERSEADFSRLRTIFTVSDIFTRVWIAGAAVMLLLFAVSNLVFRRKLRSDRTRLYASGVSLPVYVTNAVETPCLFGIVRPAIYVTPYAAENKTVLRYALEHESTHYRHGDHVWSLLRCLCLALHWFNPLVWLAVIYSRRDSELACDEGTIKRIGEGERLSYGNTLIDMTCEKRGAAALFCTATTMTAGAGGIMERISRIARRRRTLWAVAAAVLLIAALAVGCTFTGARREPGETATDVTEFMKSAATKDFTKPESLGTAAAGQLADALNSAASHEIDAAEGAVSQPYWSIYLEMSPKTTYNAGRCFSVSCGFTENIVQATLSDDGNSDIASFEDAELYWLVRRSRDKEENIDEAAYERYKAVLTQKMDAVFAERNSGLNDFSGYLLTRFIPVLSYEAADGGTVELYDFEYVLLTDDPDSVLLVAGMYFDSLLRVHGFNGGGQFAVKTRNGETACTAFMGNEAYYNPEYPETAEWVIEHVNSALA